MLDAGAEMMLSEEVLVSWKRRGQKDTENRTCHREALWPLPQSRADRRASSRDRSFTSGWKEQSKQTGRLEWTTRELQSHRHGVTRGRAKLGCSQPGFHGAGSVCFSEAKSRRCSPCGGQGRLRGPQSGRSEMWMPAWVTGRAWQLIAPAVRPWGGLILQPDPRDPFTLL